MDFLEEELKTEEQSLPYEFTISNLKEIQWIQCPVTKLSHIYNCLKFDLAQEIDQFYNKVDNKMTVIQQQMQN